MFRRRMFYVSGFDPRGGRFYHGLHRDELAAHAARTGEAITVSGRKRGGDHAIDWTVENASAAVTTAYTFLRWDDLIGKVWVRGPLQLAWRGAAAYAGYALHHDWKAYWRLGKGPFVTTLYPGVLAVLLPLLIALPVALLLTLLLPGWAAALLGLVTGIAAARPLLDKIRAFWLMRLFIQNHAQARRGIDPELIARTHAFAAAVAAALDEDHDEVLLVAHSNGSILIVPLLLELLRLRGGALPDHFALVTLGHCLPLLGCRRDAVQFHAMQRELAQYRFRWIDIGSPPDGAAFSMVDPLAPVASAAKADLTLLNPRFYVFYNPETYHSGFANKYEIHFDYLRGGDRVSPIDYPSLTANPVRIADAVARFRAIP